jgi:hypothetical protein
MRNDTDSDEFEIAYDNKDIEEPQHIPEYTENPEDPTNIVDEEDKETRSCQMQSERGQILEDAATRYRIRMESKYSSSKQSCII